MNDNIGGQMQNDTSLRAAQTTRILLHLGAHKTASTHFNRLVRRNSHLTQQFSLSCPKKDELRNLITRRLSGANLRETGPVKEEVIAALGQGAETLFLSDENIIGTPVKLVQNGIMYPHAAKRLRQALKLLGREDVELMLAVRDPASFAVSIWGESMRSWGYQSFRDYLGPDPMKALRWTPMIRRLLGVREGLNITVWTYETYPQRSTDMVARLFGRDSAEGLDMRENARVVRPGLSQRAVDEIAGLCGRLGTVPEQDVIEDLVSAFPKSDAFPAPQPWRADELDHLAKQYRRDLRALSELDGVTFLG